ncbi:SDR family NAD(P)-dependent oxidoreductase [Dongia deserti]|uniref:SDR family NAD(P)-dependent oxidoreductase n=1 Tax=Dongia deserti TaxID=2268030 RepID=UPI0013C48695|nr:SDR family NAD(P)-dependent oxidoreductase [Dongia deserti]
MTYRCALITGASSGIGEAFARALPRSTSLLLTGRDRMRLTHLAGELANADRTVRSIAADLVTAEGRRAVLGFAEGQPIDLLINNAGIGYLGRVADNPPERESEMAQLNMVAPVELTRALLPGMLKRAEGGQRAGVIFVASAAAFLPIPLFATYAASKAFLLHYAEALAEELSDDPIDILALCPGATRTRFFERANVNRANLPQLDDAERVARQGLQALGHRVVHVVGPATYLATAAARFLPRRFVAAAAERAMRRWQ